MSKRKFQQVNKKHNYTYTANALMKRIRNSDKVHIEGSKDKKLRVVKIRRNYS